MYRLVFLSLILLAAGCCPKPYPSPEERTMSFKAKAGEIFENNIVIIPNSSGEVAVMYTQPERSNRNPMPTLQIVIYNLDTDEILHRATAVRGTVKWYSNEEVHIMSAPGQISRDEPMDKGYYFNVYTKETRK
ncbi:MAG: hypothetical protein HKN68_04900 [Saprospiraceae bacterium]|nr:hypothetical protein [Saprospiraceae bacterium]